MAYPHTPMDTQHPDRRSLLRPSSLAFALVVVVGIAFRLHTRSELWLDEALSANIARLPVGDMLRQLKHDGHPPLFYLLLHGWMEIFGKGDDATRSLSGIFGIACLPLMWVAARRYAGRAAAASAVVLLATSPYAVRYSTEARMYSMVIFFVLVGWLLVRSALDNPTIARLVGIAVVSGLLALTHYWSFYLLAATALLLLWMWRRQANAAALRVTVALLAGAVLFLPWLPSFLEQSKHTGTPWGRPERPTQIFTISFTDWGGGPNGEAQFLGIALVLLVLLALFAVARDRRHIDVDLHTQPQARPEAYVVFATLLIATVASYASAAAFSSRYTAVIFPLVILLAALGMTAFADPRVRVGILVVLSLFGLLGASRNERGERTQNGHIAAYIVAHGGPGDVVAFCPDQLGPSTLRHIPDTMRGMAFPNGSDPHLIDWVDYGKRQKAGSPTDFAAMVDKAAGPHILWFVWSPGYRTLDTKCELTVNALKKLRPGGRPALASGSQFEHAWLYEYVPVAP